MSTISEHAIIKILMSDYAANDSMGKMNVIGEGINILQYTPGTTVTNRFSVITIIEVPGEYCPDEITVESSLRDKANKIIEVPGPAGPQPLRVANIVTLDNSSPVALTSQDKKFLTAKYRGIMDFSDGLPLAPGEYKWLVTIDNDENSTAEYRFCIPDLPTPPVLG